MRRIIAFVAIIAALCIYVAFTSAETLAIGGIHLSGDIELSEDSVELTNGAVLELPGSPWKCDICGKPVQSAQITAKTITADLAKVNKKLVVAKAVATSSVLIHAKQVDVAKKTTRFIHASADKAVFTPAPATGADETIVLTGNAVVRMTDPELDEPATLTGSTITVYLNKNKISAKSGDMRIKPKEGAQP